jgi:CheY-like chemotaxis protein/anti-sigma regulatory factor (Ser/Thr protein kinase)
VVLRASLAGEVPETIHSDPTRLRQILVNLVGNAVKFTSSGTVTLTARVLGSDPERRLKIEVEDTGPGLSSEQVARLFSPFGQADASVTRRHGGSGLGLSISNRLAQLLGGSVTLARTELGRGSTFCLELPLALFEGTAWSARLDLPVPRAPLPQPSESVRLNGRVLLAEDGRDNQVLVSFHLRRAGAQVDVAANGVTALELIERAEAEGRPYDLLLTDIQMPEMDGFTLTRVLRARGSRLAIVALTAHAMAEDRDRCLAAGCDDYAVKPIDKARLLTTCARWMGAPSTGPGVPADV